MKKRFSEKSFYAYKFLSECLPIYALYAILFKENGLSVTEISLLFSIWSLVALISELPSGILADRWNRKYMLCIAALLRVACYTVWSFSSGFAMFALGFFFWGIAGSFYSGTEESLVYDNLKSEGRESGFTKIYGRGRLFASLGIVTGMVLSGILASFISIRAISVLSAGLCAISFLFACRLTEKNYYSERIKEEKVSYFSTLLEAVRLCAKNLKVLISMVFLITVIGIWAYLDEYDALIIDDFGQAYIWISVIFTVRYLFIALGNHLAPAVERKISAKSKTFIFTVAASLFLLAFSLVWNRYAIPLLGIYGMIMNIAELTQKNMIQGEISEEGRATVMSLYGIGQNIAMIAFSLIYAFLSGVFSLKTVYAIIAVYCIAGTIVLYLISLAARKGANP